jgi:hypothetical protein
MLNASTPPALQAQRRGDRICLHTGLLTYDISIRLTIVVYQDKAILPLWRGGQAPPGAATAPDRRALNTFEGLNVAKGQILANRVA